MTDAFAPEWTHTALAQQIVFGQGSVRRLPELVKLAGGRKVLFVTTAGRLASDEGQQITKALGRTLAATFAEVESHVPVPLVQQAMMQARRDGVDLVVSFGGGSCAVIVGEMSWEQGDKNLAAQLLGIAARTIYRKLDRKE